MPNEKDAEIKSRYEDYSVEELRAALDSIFDSTDEFSDSDVEQMDEIMAVLDKKDPLSQRYTAEESWKHFQENYREELSRLGVRTTWEVMEEKTGKAVETDAAVVVPIAHAEEVHAGSASSETRRGKSSQTLIRTALIAAAVVALMVIITVSAAAAGFNIWGWVPVWNESTFRFVSEEAASSTSMDIPTALKHLGVDEPLFPTWLPEGFEMAEQQITFENGTFLYSAYVYKDRVIMITIRPSDEIAETAYFEKNEGDPIEYVVEDNTHFVLNNYKTTTATWRTQGYTVRIVGDITTQEMERIIDSIYEVS